MSSYTTRCTEQLSIDVSFKDSVRKWLADTGYDAKYGARPLKRVIQNKLEECGFLAPLQDYEPVNFRNQSSL